MKNSKNTYLRHILLYRMWILYCAFISGLLNTPVLGGTAQLEKMGYSTLAGNRVQISLDFSGTVQAPTNFATDNPARIVLDFSGVSLGIGQKSGSSENVHKQEIGNGAVQSMTAVKTAERTRVVVNLVNKVPFTVNTTENKVLIIIENSGAAPTSAPVTAKPKETVAAPPSVPVATPPPAPAQLPVTPRPPAPITPQPSVAPKPALPLTKKPLDTVVPPPSQLPIHLPASTKKPAGYCCGPSESKTQTLATTSVPEAVVTPEILPGSAIRDIDFRRTDEGAGQIVVTLTNPSIVVDMREEGGDIVLDFTDTHLPPKLDRRLDVMDFATPVTFIDTSTQGNNVHMVVTAKGDYEHLAYQSENTYVIEVKEVVQVAEDKEDIKIEEKRYEGKKITLDFQSVDIKAALLLLTEVVPGLNLNIITSPEVKGTVAMRLKNVPWDQALDIILESQGLGRKQVGNVMMIDLKKNISEKERSELEAQQRIKQLEPLRTEFIQINYAKASDIMNLLKASDGKNSFLSARGSVSIDVRTNHLIIQDTATRLADITRLIHSLDTPIRQVLIESKVVIADDSFRKSLGVKFGYSANQDLGSGYGVVFGGRATGDTTYAGQTAFGSGGVENFIVRLPETIANATTASVGLAVGKIGSYLLQLELSALQEEGRGEIISSPRLITGNQQTATILAGQQIPYTPAAGVGATADVQFVDAVLKLEVTPQITPDDRIIMDLKVNKDEPGTPSGGQLPINKREIQTQVLVDNGETVVLGGVYEQRTNYSVERVPFLSDLPLIGDLFKRHSNSDSRTELLIFVTPKIIKETT